MCVCMCKCVSLWGVGVGGAFFLGGGGGVMFCHYKFEEVKLI